MRRRTTVLVLEFKLLALWANERRDKDGELSSRLQVRGNDGSRAFFSSFFLQSSFAPPPAASACACCALCKSRMSVGQGASRYRFWRQQEARNQGDVHLDPQHFAAGLEVVLFRLDLLLQRRQVRLEREDLGVVERLGGFCGLRSGRGQHRIN